MSAPVKRPDPNRRLLENRQRVIALEQVPRLGMGVELTISVQADFDGSEPWINNWEIVNDPHGYYDIGTAASQTAIIVPEGLGGIYMVSMSWALQGAD